MLQSMLIEPDERIFLTSTTDFSGFSFGAVVWSKYCSLKIPDGIDVDGSGSFKRSPFRPNLVIFAGIPVQVRKGEITVVKFYFLKLG